MALGAEIALPAISGYAESNRRAASDLIDGRAGRIISITDRYHQREKNQMPATAKIFMHGRSQAVRLPKEFRLPGKEVRVSRVGDKVILEPIEQPPFDVKAWRAKLDALGARDFLPEGLPDETPVAPDDDISFD